MSEPDNYNPNHPYRWWDELMSESHTNDSPAHVSSGPAVGSGSSPFFSTYSTFMEPIDSGNSVMGIGREVRELLDGNGDVVGRAYYGPDIEMDGSVRGARRVLDEDYMFGDTSGADVFLTRNRFSLETPQERPPNRIGKFSISVELIRDNWPQVSNILAGMVVVGARVSYDRNVVDYTAYCNDFDMVPLFMEAPTYHCLCTTEELTDSVVVQWVREGTEIERKQLQQAMFDS